MSLVFASAMMSNMFAATVNAEGYKLFPHNIRFTRSESEFDFKYISMYSGETIDLFVKVDHSGGKHSYLGTGASESRINTYDDYTVTYYPITGNALNVKKVFQEKYLGAESLGSPLVVRLEAIFPLPENQFVRGKLVIKSNTNGTGSTVETDICTVIVKEKEPIAFQDKYAKFPICAHKHGVTCDFDAINISRTKLKYSAIMDSFTDTKTDDTDEFIILKQVMSYVYISGKNYQNCKQYD